MAVMRSIASRFGLRRSLLATAAVLALGTVVTGPWREADARDRFNSVATGFGNAVPLSFALKGILPAGYLAHFEPGANPSATVSWSGGKPWPDVLHSVLDKVGMHARIEGMLVRVEPGAGPVTRVSRPGLIIAAGPRPSLPVQATTITPEAHAAPAAEPHAPRFAALQARYAKLQAEAESSAQPRPVPAAKPGMVQQTRQEAPQDQVRSTFVRPVLARPLEARSTLGRSGRGWHIQAGETLFQVLSIWSQQAGWNPPVYRSPMVYPMAVTLTLQGSFKDVVTKLIDGVYGTPRPRAIVHELSKVIEITDDDHISESLQ